MTGAISLAQQGYGSYNPWIYEEHLGSPDGSSYTRNPLEGYFPTFGRPLRDDEIVIIDGRKYANIFWSMFDLWYSQTDDTVITEGLEDFELEGILDSFLEFCKKENMDEDVYDFNVRKFINNESCLPLPKIMDYPLYRSFDILEEGMK